MNRTDRLLAIVLELQGKGMMRAEDLADIFETSRRTIYRDIQALGQAGVPLISVPGRGYSLIEGYFLPPLNFSVEEATSLLLGSASIAHTFDAQYRAAAQSASRKIESVLTLGVQEKVRDLRQSLAFVGLGPHVGGDEADLLVQLRRAIIDRQRICFTYHARSTQTAESEQTRREADPYGLFFNTSAWYLSAYCHLRQGMRNFRLERMSELAILDQTFTRPAEYRMGVRRQDVGSRVFHARVLFAPEVARWVLEERFFFMTGAEETPEGLVVTLHARRAEDTLNWLLGWGSRVRVLEPATLRQQVEREATAILELYGDAH